MIPSRLTFFVLIAMGAVLMQVVFRGAPINAPRFGTVTTASLCSNRAPGIRRPYFQTVTC
jgi:hypothetical protein